MISYNLRTVKGQTFKIEVEEGATVLECKNKFREMFDPDAKEIKFFFKAKILDDNAVISTLGIKEKDNIIVHIKKAPAQPAPQPSQQAPPQPVEPKPAETPKPAPSERPSAPQATPLPDISSFNQEPEINLDELVKSPEFQGSLQTLQELGFPASDCEAALKAALGDPNLAVSFLESGKIPTEDQIRQAQDIHRQSQLVRQDLQAHPEKLIQIITSIESQSPEQGAILRANPEIILAQLGLDPASFNLDEIKATAPPGTPTLEELMQSGRSGEMGPGLAPRPGAAPGAGPAPAPERQPNPVSGILSNYNDEERESIKRLQELGFELSLVVQVFEACDRNENMTANCLLGMQ
jgi:UV excision repair protein RAD23